MWPRVGLNGEESRFFSFVAQSGAGVLFSFVAQRAVQVEHHGNRLVFDLWRDMDVECAGDWSSIWFVLNQWPIAFGVVASG